MVALMAHHLRSLLCTSGALLMGATRGTVTAFSPGVKSPGPPRRTATSGVRPSAAAAMAVPADNATHTLQRIWDELSAGAQLHEVEGRMMEVETEVFWQASAWSKTFTPLKTVVAEVAGRMSVSVLVLPRGTKLGWQRHDEAQSISKQLFGSLKICDLELQGSDNARKLEQQELEATYTDAWAVGGSVESDCVCRGGRCPRMWDCPFWVDRRRAEAKGSSAHVALKFPGDNSCPGLWRAGPRTVRRLEALEPSALLEIHVGARKTRYYQEIESQVEDAVELIEILSPLGVKPGVSRYLGPFVEVGE